MIPSSVQRQWGRHLFINHGGLVAVDLLSGRVQALDILIPKGGAKQGGLCLTNIGSIFRHRLPSKEAGVEGHWAGVEALVFKSLQDLRKPAYVTSWEDGDDEPEEDAAASFDSTTTLTLRQDFSEEISASRTVWAKLSSILGLGLQKFSSLHCKVGGIQCHQVDGTGLHRFFHRNSEARWVPDLEEIKLAKPILE